MSLRSRIFTLPMPGFLRAACIKGLADVAASAFGCSPQRISSLDRFAVFTARQAGAALGAARATSEIEARLFDGAEKLGGRLRFWLGIRRRQEALEVARALYRVIEVDFRPDLSGSFIVPRCRFSSCYSPAICRLISSLDAGLLSGLTGGARLTFARRITEGAAFCTGVVQ